MITKLTKKQKSLMPQYVDKWINVGMRTGAVDLEKSKAAVCRAYELAGLSKPTQFYVANSPIHAIKIIQSLDSTLSAEEIFNNMIYGNHEAYWLSYIDFFKTEVGIKNLEKVDGLMDLAEHCGWLNVYEDVVVFQERPNRIMLDDQKRLHCQDGAAILYEDGFSIHAWHGVRIPSEWIENKKSLTPKIALKWNNIEQRRAACEILGWTNILSSLKMEVIDADNDPEIGVLVECNIPDSGKERFLRVLCGTKREFALPVPREMKTALEANAWTFGFDADTFIKPEVRT